MPTQKRPDRSRLTATRATGEITQLIGDLEQGTLEEVTHDSPGTGIGPSLLVQGDLLKRPRLSVSLVVGGAFIFYDRDFPSGGERYNFMWRFGPSLSYSFANTYALGVSYRWMHLSNGKGPDLTNPSYDARGLGLQLSHVF